MSYPNNVLSAWQMALMIAVPLAMLIGWIIAIFIAARDPRVTDAAASASAAETAAPAPRPTGLTVPVSPAAPARPDASPARLAA
jgi:hypothetical protein